MYGTSVGHQNVVVDCDFPGGNIVVDKIAGNTIVVHQDLRDTVGDWFYWYFRVRNASGRTLTVRFSGSDVFGASGPAVSNDGGQTWRWLGADSTEGQSVRYTVPAEVSEVRFSFGMPYLEANLRQFLHQHQASPYLAIEEFCQSTQGRTVELLRLGCLDGRPEHRVLLTCRHHCCEMMASYVLEGVMDTVLTNMAFGQWLRDRVEFLVVPFVDKDGVEAGDQGKNRAPHDHNRDYGNSDGIYPSVRAIRELVRDQRAGNIDAAFDLHCPWKSGELHETIHFVGTRNANNWNEVQKFSDLLERLQQGSLTYRKSANLPHGVAWNVDARYGERDESQKVLLSFSTFLDTVPGVGVHSGLEIPYANADGREVNAETARAFGSDLARAVQVYLQGKP